MKRPVAISQVLATAAALTFSLTVTGQGDNPTDLDTGKCHFDLPTGTWECDGVNVSDLALALDWLPDEALSDERRAQLLPGCHGAYVDPLAGDKTLDQADINALPLIIDADDTEATGAEFVRLSGEVRVSQGPRTIAAEEMRYDRAGDNAKLDGAVSIRQPGMLIRGQNAQVSTSAQKGRFDQARIVFHDMHMRGSAEAIIQEGPDKVVLRNGVITSCEPGTNAWLLKGQELGVDQAEGQGYGKNIRLSVGGVPVFYLPYISFPIGDERRSGFLFPSISSSDDGGLDVSVPYYLNLAPNYDMTLSPRFISGRGAMLETEFRHLNRQFETQLSGSYLSNDRGGSDSDVDRLIASDPAYESTLRPHKGSNRWLVQLQQVGGRREGWFSDIDYTKTSDEDYFRDLGTSSFEIANTTYLSQSVAFGVINDHWLLRARAQDYQTLLLDLDEPYRKVPELTANGVYRFGKAETRFNNQLTRFDHSRDQRFDGSAIITGDRLATDYRLHASIAKAGAYLRPELGFKSLYYQLDDNELDPVNNTRIALSAPQASLDMGLVFEHPGGRFLQTLEPRAYYLFREYEDHSELYDATARGQNINFDTSIRTFSFSQLYRDSRFSGYDRLDDANQVTVGVSSRWQANSDGHEFLNFSLGQINHFRDRRVGFESEVSEEEKSSEWALEFGYRWRNDSGLYGGLVYDDAANETDRFGFGYNYASRDSLSLFSISYSYVRANPESRLDDTVNLDQVDTAWVAPVKEQWFILGRANYDIENQQELEAFAGFEYNDCCYRVRLIARRWLDSSVAKLVDNDDAIFDQGVFFELHLKGLGGSGAKVNDLLEDAIPGYERRENLLNNTRR